MDIKKKRYYIVFTGLFLVILGMLIYALRPVKKIKKESNVLTKVSAVKTVKVVKAEKAKGLPLNFVYDVPSDYKRTIPHYVGMKRHIEDMDNMQIVCNGKNCKRQVLKTSKVKVYHTKKAKKTLSVVNGNVVFSKNNLKYLKSDVKIIGDLYIKDINFLKIPDNFIVLGNIYLINSEGLTFMGKTYIDGHIFVKGKSSVRALPYNVKLTGQIFI